MSHEVEVCVGCGHPIAMHFNDVTGVARCLVVKRRGLSTSGVVGLPLPDEPCSCANFARSAGGK